MLSVDYITNLLVTYQAPAIFLGAFFFGETVIITAAFLAAHGVWSISLVFWLALIGTVVSDSLWFFLGRYFFVKTNRWQNEREKYDHFLVKLERLFGRKPFLILLFIKFLYGTRILTIVYLSLRRMPFWLFLLFNTLGTVIWLLVVLAIGWFAGLGIANILPVFHRVEYAVSILLLILVLYKIVSSWIEKKIAKE